MANAMRDESELYLEAMLYLLEDPSIDRVAFEARLADDARLGEILAEAVSMYQSLRSIDADSPSVVYAAKSTCQTSGDSCVQPNAEVISHHFNWPVLATIAASLLLVGYLGMNVFRSIGTTTIETALVDGSSTLPNHETSQASSELALWNNIVWAWGELRTGSREHHLTQQVSYVENETPFASLDSICENDVPEWLVLATAAFSEQGSGIDSLLEEVDTRTLIQ